jgi:hypothetical protein
LLLLYSLGGFNGRKNPTGGGGDASKTSRCGDNNDDNDDYGGS